MNKVDASIFKAYDIRGVYPDQLNEDLAYRIGLAYSEILKRENPGKKLQIVLSCDMRLSTPSLKKSILEGLLDSGVDVVDIGLSSTPTFYFAVSYYGYDGGIQVSASHNPKEYNGFKMVRAGAVPVSGERGIYEIRDLVMKNRFGTSQEKGLVVKRENVLEEEFLQQSKGIDLAGIKPFKIVVDTGNAMGALDIEEIFKHLSCKLIKLNFELDGNFPVHLADPLKEENLVQAQEEVVKQNADLAIVIDGDGDRYFFIDERGEVVPQPILRGLMAQVALKDHPGATVCYDIRPGKITAEMIEEAGGKAVVTRVGHSLIKEKMLEVDAVFGGESSGHYFYKFVYGTFEAPIVLVLKFLEYVCKNESSVSEVVALYKKYFHSGEINSEVSDKEGKMKEIAEKYKDAEISWLDGVTVTYSDYWFNVRPSNTQNLLRLNLEARTKDLMDKKRDEVLEFIRA